jgi:uncharacterized protein (TIGR03435 family)
MSLRRSGLFPTLLFAAAGIGAPAQSRPSGPSFEVASIRVRQRDATGSMTFGILISGNHATITGTVSRLLMEAYGVLDYQILGAADWVRSLDAHYTIIAKVEGDAEPSRALVKEMLQTLLAERFQLRLHRESQPRQILALVVGKDGVKMKESEPEARSGVRYRSGDMNGSRLNMAYLAVFLSNQMKQPIIDKTELKGLYDFTLRWTPDEAPETSATPDQRAASIYTAVQEQLGLKLVSQKGDMEVLVIDHVEKPTEN